MQVGWHLSITRSLPECLLDLQHMLCLLGQPNIVEKKYIYIPSGLRDQELGPDKTNAHSQHFLGSSYGNNSYMQERSHPT